jgi:hypothetical protein
MSNETLHLLKALTDALGFEIKETEHKDYSGNMLPVITYELTKKKPKARPQAKPEGYSEDFIDFWSIYPKGHGGSKKEAYRQYAIRLSEYDSGYGVDAIILDIYRSAEKYAIKIKATHSEAFIMHPATFLGRDKHYLNDFTVSASAIRQNREKQDWEKIPENDATWMDFAEEHGFKINGSDSVFDNKIKLQRQIKDRIENEIK